MFSRWLFPVLLLLAASALAGEVAASDLPPIDLPGVWHEVTQDDSTSDSKCIGKPVTPLCAVETIFACFLRGQDELCRIAMSLDHLPGLGPGRPYPGGWERYRVAAVKRVDPKKQRLVVATPTKAGDVILNVQHLRCQFSQCQTRVGPPTTYLVRPKGDGWVVLDWETPRW